jgi:protein gp37
MNRTNIAWADYVWNPVTGCTKVSQGCKNCYAESLAHRFWKTRKFTDVVCHEDRLDQPLHVKKPGRVFVNSMSDLFHPDVPDGFIDKVGMVVTKAKSGFTWIILTKRPERMKRYFRDYGCFADNVWLGVSVEDQKTADERIPILLSTNMPSGKRFVSYEPALEKVSLSYPLNGCPEPEGNGTKEADWVQTCPPLDWVIMGCESGPNRRSMDIEWARSMRDQCQAAHVPFFLKQMQVNGKVVEMPELDGVVYDQYPAAKP